MNFRQGANLDMAGSGAGLIKGTLRSRMEQVLLEDDDKAANKNTESEINKDRWRSQNSQKHGKRQDYPEKKRFVKESDDQRYARRETQARSNQPISGREPVTNLNFKQTCD